LPCRRSRVRSPSAALEKGNVTVRTADLLRRGTGEVMGSIMPVPRSLTANSASRAFRTRRRARRRLGRVRFGSGNRRPQRRSDRDAPGCWSNRSRPDPTRALGGPAQASRRFDPIRSSSPIPADHPGRPRCSPSRSLSALGPAAQTPRSRPQRASSAPPRILPLSWTSSGLRGRGPRCEQSFALVEAGELRGVASREVGSAPLPAWRFRRSRRGRSRAACDWPGGSAGCGCGRRSIRVRSRLGLVMRARARDRVSLARWCPCLTRFGVVVCVGWRSVTAGGAEGVGPPRRRLCATASRETGAALDALCAGPT